MAYNLTHTGAELDAAIDRIQAQTKLSAITLSASDITTAGSAFSVTPGSRYTAAGESLAINLGSDLTSTLIASNIKSGVSILGITGTYSAAVIGTWTFGEHSTATLYSDGTMVVSGYGVGNDQSSFYGSPWATYRTQIVKILFDDRITEIGDYSFCGSTNLASVRLPQSLKNIGVYVFYGCTSLERITIPGNLAGIDQGAFSNCTGLVAVTFNGTPSALSSDTFGYNNTTLTDIYVPWASGAVSGAPWGATNEAIHYDAYDVMICLYGDNATAFFDGNTFVYDGDSTSGTLLGTLTAQEQHFAVASGNLYMTNAAVTTAYMFGGTDASPGISVTRYSGRYASTHYAVVSVGASGFVEIRIDT